MQMQPLLWIIFNDSSVPFGALIVTSGGYRVFVMLSMFRAGRCSCKTMRLSGLRDFWQSLMSELLSCSTINAPTANSCEQLSCWVDFS